MSSNKETIIEHMMKIAEKIIEQDKELLERLSKR